METVHDIARFATESHSSPLVTLTPETYASAIDSGDEWLIDYYAPVSYLLFFVGLSISIFSVWHFIFSVVPTLFAFVGRIEKAS